MSQLADHIDDAASQIELLHLRIPFLMPKLADHINNAAVKLDLWIPTASVAV